MKIEPYLFFEGRCDEAVEFYRKRLGAEVGTLMRYKESPEPPAPGMLPPGSENKVMHGVIQIGDTKVMVSDGRCSGKTAFQGFALTITAPDVSQADKMFSGAGKDLLLAALRHGHRPLRRVVDDHRRAVRQSAETLPAGRVWPVDLPPASRSTGYRARARSMPRRRPV
jgi:PhnB protein